MVLNFLVSIWDSVFSYILKNTYDICINETETHYSTSIKILSARVINRIRIVQMQPIWELFCVEYRLLKINPMGIEAGIPLTHQLMDPPCRWRAGLLLERVHPCGFGGLIQPKTTVVTGLGCVGEDVRGMGLALQESGTPHGHGRALFLDCSTEVLGGYTVALCWCWYRGPWMPASTLSTKELNNSVVV
jgi:hypothetical protein